MSDIGATGSGLDSDSEGSSREILEAAVDKEDSTKRSRGRPKGSRNKKAGEKKESERHLEKTKENRDQNTLLTGKWGLKVNTDTELEKLEAQIDMNEEKGINQDRQQDTNKENQVPQKDKANEIGENDSEEENDLDETIISMQVREEERKTELVNTNSVIKEGGSGMREQNIDSFILGCRIEHEVKQMMEELKQDMKEEERKRQKEMMDEITNIIGVNIEEMGNVNKKLFEISIEKANITNQNKRQMLKKELKTQMTEAMTAIKDRLDELESRQEKLLGQNRNLADKLRQSEAKVKELSWDLKEMTINNSLGKHGVAHCQECAKRRREETALKEKLAKAEKEKIKVLETNKNLEFQLGQVKKVLKMDSASKPENIETDWASKVQPVIIEDKVLDEADRFHMKDQERYDQEWESGEAAEINVSKLLEPNLAEQRRREKQGREAEWVRKTGEADGNKPMQEDKILKKPEKLSREETLQEMKHRAMVKRDIVIDNMLISIDHWKELVWKKLHVNVTVVNSAKQGQKTIITVATAEQKKEIMKRRKAFWAEDINIKMEDNMTERQREVQDWLEKTAVEERKKGCQVITGHLNICRNGMWYEWNEYEGKLIYSISRKAKNE